jgi:glycosyltransferase involved in cell wall biosynthesis
VSIVIPAYNEALRLPATIAGWIEFLRQQEYGSEIVVVDDGSQDATATVVERTIDELAAMGAPGPAVRLIRLPSNQGKGGAVRAGMRGARGRYRFYVDADLNIAPGYVTPALRLLRTDYAVVAGRRALSDYAAAERSVARLLAGAAVQLTRRLFVLPTIQDTQCGFKGFRAATAEAVFRRTLIHTFAFDVEVLFLARRLGARIAELPVTTTYRPGSTYVLRRHLLPFLQDVLRIRLNALRGAYR